jgi:hypothetical protein
MPSMTLDQIRALPNGLQKKFLILKHHGKQLRATTNVDISQLGCETLLSLLGVNTRGDNHELSR